MWLFAAVIRQHVPAPARNAMQRRHKVAAKRAQQQHLHRLHAQPPDDKAKHNTVCGARQDALLVVDRHAFGHQKRGQVGINGD